MQSPATRTADPSHRLHIALSFVLVATIAVAIFVAGKLLFDYYNKKGTTPTPVSKTKERYRPAALPTSSTPLQRGSLQLDPGSVLRIADRTGALARAACIVLSARRLGPAPVTVLRIGDWLTLSLNAERGLVLKIDEQTEAHYPLPDTEWHLVGVAFAKGRASILLDGNDTGISVRKPNATISEIQLGPGPLLVRDLTVWASPLTPAQMAALPDDPRQLGTDLLGWWKLDDSDGVLAPDSAGSNSGRVHPATQPPNSNSVVVDIKMPRSEKYKPTLKTSFVY